MSDKTQEEKPFWKSVKFYYALMAIAAFLALVFTGTLTVTTDQAINFILTIFGINVGSHAATNISAIIGQFFGRNGSVTALAPATEELLPNMEIDAPMPPVKPSEDRTTPIETPVPRDVDES